jgi:hypothetical protein
MFMKSHWVEHKGKRIFISDYSGLRMNYSALQEEADFVIAALTKEPLHSVLSVTTVTDTIATADTVAILQKVPPMTNDHVYRRAVVGIQGIRWYLISAFNKIAGKVPFKVFPTLQEALDWIVKE